ncbi:MAG: hypothetical protein IIZ55_03025, partial [Firmicutes bacterium]|nr:hypothetical protein [Bacillota bacterium]
NILLHFNAPDKFSVVLNPQRKIIRAFLGPEHPEVPLIMELPIRTDRRERKTGERAVAALPASERKKSRRQRARRRRKRFERRRRRGRR